MSIRVGAREVGDDQPCLVVAELGQNHNGDETKALEMVRAAHAAGADLVKLQKRTPELCVPVWLQGQPKETPSGVMTYLDYRRSLELPPEAFEAIDVECKRLGIGWFASAWDPPSLDFLLRYDPPCLKIASASVTDLELLGLCNQSRLPTIMSTGMSTVAEIDRAVACFMNAPLILLWCRSTYPCDPKNLNLSAIASLRERYGVQIGLSDHTTGLWLSLCAVAMGACVIERHLTLNRSAWGTDHAASLEPHGFAKLVQQIRRFEEAKGDGELGPIPSEDAVRHRLRRVL